MMKVKFNQGIKKKPFCIGFDEFLKLQEYHALIFERSPLDMMRMHDDKKCIYREHVLPCKRNFKILDKYNNYIVLLRKPEDSYNNYCRLTGKEDPKILEDLELFNSRYRDYLKNKDIPIIEYEDLILNYEKTMKKIKVFWKIKAKTIPLQKQLYTGVGDKRLMDSKKLRHLYDKNYFMNRVEGHQSFKKGEIDKRKIDVLEGIDIKDKTVLDVGYGRGETLKLCIDKGCKKAIGIDFSTEAYNIASKYLDGKAEIYNIDIEDIDKIKEDSIELLFMFDVIEHISNDELNSFLKKLKDKIYKYTELYITTPTNIERGQFKGMHINQWDKEKIKKVFGKYFEKVIIKTIRNGNQFYIKCREYDFKR
jgi:2-polyprenyl-3-methyl-5-hydroxy-6-metoxy-1,4-benzoquinol methylase